MNDLVQKKITKKLYLFSYRMKMIRIKSFKKIMIIFMICSIVWIFERHYKLDVQEDHIDDIVIVQLDDKTMKEYKKTTTIVNITYHHH